MLYELIAVVRPGNLAEVREIARTAGTHVLRGKGVIRGFTNWGTFMLTKPRTLPDNRRYTQGHYFIMQFDSSYETQMIMRRTLSLDPRLVRYSLLKVATKLQEVASVTGKVPWPSTPKE